MPPSISSFLTPYLLSIVVSCGIGLIIGLEREFRKTNEKDHFAGIRTFPLVCLLGCLITFVGSELSIWIIVGCLVAFIGFVCTTYFVRATKEHTGITTEISLIVTFILGMMTSQQMIKESLAAMVLTTTLLTLKGQFHSFVLKISEDELFAFVKFIILCLLLFPFLPDTPYGPNGILNPQEIGFVVVVVSSISFIGYLLVKFAGTNRGILLTALLGGMVSSTAVTWTFANASKKADAGEATLYATGIVLASSIMFLRVVVVAMVFSTSLGLALMIPCAIMFMSGFIFVLSFLKKSKTSMNEAAINLVNPVNILNALGFGLMYVAIAYLVFYGQTFFGNRGLLISGLISGFADVDAITINVAKLSKETIGEHLSVTIVVLAIISNTFVKLMITILQATKDVRRKVMFAMIVMILSATIFVLFF